MTSSGSVILQFQKDGSLIGILPIADTDEQRVQLLEPGSASHGCGRFEFHLDERHIAY
jgi:hypothetical protein